MKSFYLLVLTTFVTLVSCQSSKPKTEEHFAKPIVNLPGQTNVDSPSAAQPSSTGISPPVVVTTKDAASKEGEQDSLKPADLKDVNKSLFSSVNDARATLFCGYFTSSCESQTSSSNIALVSKDNDTYVIELLSHDNRQSHVEPKRYYSRTGAGIPTNFTSYADKKDQLDVFSTCGRGMKNGDVCSVTIAKKGKNRLFRGLCSMQGVREYTLPCAGKPAGAPGGIRKAKLEYGAKTFDLPLVYQGQMPAFAEMTLAPSNLGKVRSLVVGHKIGELPPWIEPGSWDEWFSFPPTDWSKTGYSVITATLPVQGLVYLLVQPAYRFEELVVRDLATPPTNARAVFDGRDCDQPGMVVGFSSTPDSTLNLDGLFINGQANRLEWKHGLKAFCH